MELAAKNDQNGANLKTGPTATMAGAAEGMPTTVSGDMRVCQKSGTHGRWQRDLAFPHSRLGEDSQGQGCEQGTLARNRLENVPPPTDPMS